MKKVKKMLITSPLSAFVISILASANTALASGMVNSADAPDVAVTSGLREAIRGFMNYFLGFLGLIAVIFVVYAGILMVTAQGEEEQVEKGKKILIWAAAGIIIVMLSFAIVSWIAAAGDVVA